MCGFVSKGTHDGGDKGDDKAHQVIQLGIISTFLIQRGPRKGPTPTYIVESISHQGQRMSVEPNCAEYN